MENFTPISALIGGALIGLSAVVLMLFNGRIAGISGIAGGLVRGADRGWRMAFLAGLIGAPIVYVLLTRASLVSDISINPLLLIGAGLLVGVGTQMGGGCTSGHGVCGTARLSVRSIVAMLTFMATGIATVFVMGLLS